MSAERFMHSFLPTLPILLNLWRGLYGMQSDKSLQETQTDLRLHWLCKKHELFEYPQFLSKVYISCVKKKNKCMGHTTKKSVFEVFWNSKDQDPLAKPRNLISTFVIYNILFSIQKFCKRTVKAQIRLCICTVWSGPLLVGSEGTFLHGDAHI